MKAFYIVFLSLGIFLTGCAGSQSPQSADFEVSTELGWPYNQFVVTQEYGQSHFEGEYRNNFHWGIDISQGPHSFVFPIAPGYVVGVGTDDCPNIPDRNCNYGYGNWVLIDHRHLGYKSFYGHLAQKAHVRVGYFIKRSEPIGYEGRSGHVFLIRNGEQGEHNSPTHLHLSIGDIRLVKTKDDKLDVRVGKLKNPRDVLPR